MRPLFQGDGDMGPCTIDVDEGREDRGHGHFGTGDDRVHEGREGLVLLRQGAAPLVGAAQCIVDSLGGLLDEVIWGIRSASLFSLCWQAHIPMTCLETLVSTSSKTLGEWWETSTSEAGCILELVEAALEVEAGE